MFVLPEKAEILYNFVSILLVLDFFKKPNKLNISS